MSTRPGSRSRPVVGLVAGLAVVVVLAVVLVVALLVRSAPEEEQAVVPPFSIATEPGAVVVDIARSQDAAGLVRALAGVGVAAEVDFVPSGQRCRPDRYAAAPVARRTRTTLEVGRHVVATLDRRDVPAGTTVVLEVSLGSGAPFASLGLAAGPVAPCEPEEETSSGS